MVSPEQRAFSAPEFATPPVDCTLLPWWFWNGDLDPEEISRQVNAMADAGVRGFFILARQGLSVPYLSEEWFARVDVALDAAERRDMRVWLYDEYPYPSGIAGGLVTAELPRARQKRLETFRFDASGRQRLQKSLALGRLVSAMAYPIENGRVSWGQGLDLRAFVGILQPGRVFREGRSLTDYSHKRFFSSDGELQLIWEPPDEGRWRAFIGIETEVRGFKYYDCFVDVLEPGATDAFIRVTHEAYASRYGDKFGTLVQGIYADEISAPAWSPVLQEELLVRYGIDLARDLAALSEDDHPEAGWCQEHHLIYTGEKPILRPEHLAHVGLPGNDAGHVRVGGAVERLSANLRKNPRLCQSGAHHYGADRALVECFHSMGWGARLQDYKWVIDWLSAMGSNLFCNHAFLYSIGGLRKHDAAPSQFYQNPYWPHFRLLGDYVARLSYALSRGDEVAPILVLHPTESLGVGGGEGSDVEDEYGQLLDALMGEHRVFHIVGGRTLHNAEAHDGILCIGRGRYEVLLVPRLCAVDQETALGIERVAEAGLPVFTIEPKVSLDVDGTDLRAVVRAPGMRQFACIDDMLAALAKHPRPVSACSPGGGEDPRIWLVHRRASSEDVHQVDLVWLTNLTGEPRTLEVSLRSDALGWERLSIEDGSCEPQPARREGPRLHTTVTLPAYGGVLLRASDTPAILRQAEHRPVTLRCAGEWEYALDRPNALRLNRWRIGLDDRVTADPSYDDTGLPIVTAKPLRNQLAMLADGPWARGAPEVVWYRRTVWCDVVPPRVRMLVENEALIGEWKCYVNGCPVLHEEFRPEPLYDLDNLSAAVAHLLREGANVIAFRFERPPLDGGLLQPIHLIGEFAVHGRTERHLGPLPASTIFGKPAESGLPHYSGTITYRRRIAATEIAGATRLMLDTGGPFYDLAEVRLDGRSLGVRAWAPYVWTIAPDEAVGASVTVEIAITNTLLPVLEGQQWDDSTHSSVDV